MPDAPDHPIAYTALRPGTPVQTSDAVQFATVETVLVDVKVSVFDGIAERGVAIAVTEPGGARDEAARADRSRAEAVDPAHDGSGDAAAAQVHDARVPPIAAVCLVTFVLWRPP